MKKHFTRFLLGTVCVLLLAGHAGQIWRIPFLSVVDAYFYDVRVRLDAASTTDDRVVIVDLDEKSLAEIGRWPWGRNTLAELVRRLTDDGKAAVVGFDVVFAEPDDSSGLRVLERLGREQLRGERGYQEALQGLRSSLDYDRLFAETLRGRPVVLGYYFSDVDDARQSGALPPPVLTADAFAGHPAPVLDWKGFGANLPALQQAALAAGHFNPVVDFDGVSRRIPLLVRHEGGYYEALALAVVRTLLGGVPVRPVFPDAATGMEWLEVGSGATTLSIPTDEAATALIPFRGPQRSFSYLSAVDVLRGRVDLARLQGRIVLVGTTAPGLMDLRATPVGAAYPGVEAHANMIAGILDGRVKQKPTYVVGADVLQVLVFGGMLVFLLPLLSPMRAFLLVGVTLFTLFTLNMAVWHGGLVLPLAAALLAILLLFALNMAWGYFVESRVKKQITELFGQYVPPELVDEMARDPGRYSMAGRNQDLTVLFSDIRNFTTISEGLDPGELGRLMNDYLGAMTAIIRRNRGTLDKYIGDAIMAFWGAPVADSDHARHAVLTALAMQREIRRLDEPFRARGWPALHAGIGINTGTMTVGDMGSAVRKAYTVLGDAVNAGARLEGLTKEYGVDILVGEATKAQVKDMVFREIDRVRPKGKGEPLAIYEPLGLQGEVPEDTLDELKLWQHALRLYRAQEWDQAELQLHNLSRRWPERRLYDCYVERIRHLRAAPPGDGWDGVTTFRTK